MKIIKPGYRILNEPIPTKKIERVARICYKSEDKIDYGTDIKMCNNLKARKHTAMLEHANIIAQVDLQTYSTLCCAMTVCSKVAADYEDPIASYKRPSYLRTTEYITSENTAYDTSESRYIVSGNLRAWTEMFENIINLTKVQAMQIPMVPLEPLYDAIAEESCGLTRLPKDIENSSKFDIFFRKTDNGLLIASDYTPTVKIIHDVSELSSTERMVHETFTVIFTVDRGVTHELVRMRDCSFAQESTRYCNYSQGKFDNEITVIKPCFFKEDTEVYNEWVMSCEEAEKSYFILLNEGATPQEARSVLPNALKSEIAMTTNLREWYHIFNLRACDATGPAHPQMSEVMRPLLTEAQSIWPFAFDSLKIPTNEEK